MKHRMMLHALGYFRIKYFLINLAFYSKAFAKLTMARLRHGECFVVENGFCCDTGFFAREDRFTNPWTAARWLYCLNTEEWSDGPSSGCIGDGTMWHDDYCYSQAPGGWDELRADREAEDDERFEREISDRS